MHTLCLAAEVVEHVRDDTAPARAAAAARTAVARTAAQKVQQARELAILREAYDAPRNPYRREAFLTNKMARDLVARTGRTERQVRIWFQNERQRRKQRKGQSGTLLRAAVAAEAAAAYAAAVQAA